MWAKSVFALSLGSNSILEKRGLHTEDEHLSSEEEILVLRTASSLSLF
jgi:hypothetical protein